MKIIVFISDQVQQMKRCRWVFFCDIQYDEIMVVGEWERNLFFDDVDDGEDDHA